MKGQKETPRKLPGVLFALIKKASSLQLPVIKLESFRRFLHRRQ